MKKVLSFFVVLMMLSSMSCFAQISVPTSNIDLQRAENSGYATLYNCQHDDTGGGWKGIGYVQESSVLKFTIRAANAGSYRLKFYSGADGCSSNIKVSVIHDGSVLASKSFHIKDTRNWVVTELHSLDIPNLPSGNSVVKLEVLNQDGGFAGNFGNFSVARLNGNSTQTSQTTSSSNRSSQTTSSLNNKEQALKESAYKKRSNAPLNNGRIEFSGKIDFVEGVNNNAIIMHDCQLDATNGGWIGIGYVVGSSELKMKMENTHPGDYEIIFYHGADGCSSTIEVAVIDDATNKIMGKETFRIRDINDWRATVRHSFTVKYLEKRKYTIRLRVLNYDGAFAGNFGNFETRWVSISI